MGSGVVTIVRNFSKPTYNARAMNAYLGKSIERVIISI